jgi:hypothetical protein
VIAGIGRGVSILAVAGEMPTVEDEDEGVVNVGIMGTENGKPTPEAEEEAVAELVLLGMRETHTSEGECEPLPEGVESPG